MSNEVPFSRKSFEAFLNSLVGQKYVASLSGEDKARWDKAINDTFELEQKALVSQNLNKYLADSVGILGDRIQAAANKLTSIRKGLMDSVYGPGLSPENFLAVERVVAETFEETMRQIREYVDPIR